MTSRSNAISIFNAAVKAVQPGQLIPQHLLVEAGQLTIFGESVLLQEHSGIFVIGAGKAAAAMAQVTESLLGPLLSDGIVVTKYGYSVPLQKIRCVEAAHPIPDDQSLGATETMLDLLRQTTKDDFIICLLSGGASSLWADLPQGVSLPELQQVFTLL